MTLGMHDFESGDLAGAEVLARDPDAYDDRPSRADVEPEPCVAPVDYGGTWDPVEVCGEPVEPGEELCSRHLED